MKAAAVFAFRVLALTVILILIFMLAINVAGMNGAAATKLIAPTPAEQAQQAAATLPPVLAYTFLISLVLAWIIQNSRWRGLKLIAALTFTFYGLMTFITQIESLVYLRAKMPPGLIRQLFVMGAVIAVLFVPIAVLVMGKVRGPQEPSIEGKFTPASHAARFAILGLVYVVLYYLFGRYVAWQNPELRLYYTGSTELTSFFQQMRSTVVSMPWMLPLQFGRGLLWALFAYPVIRMLKATRVETACTIAALFGVWSFVLLMPNPLMPASVAHSHFWETLWCDLLLGAIVGWVLAGEAYGKPNSRGQLQAPQVERMSEAEGAHPLL
jgi:hypothetical protein